jgi:hypothetical protein
MKNMEGFAEISNEILADSILQLPTAGIIGDDHIPRMDVANHLMRLSSAGFIFKMLSK